MLVSCQSGGRGWSVLRSGGDDLSVSFVTGRFSGASLGDYIRCMEQAESMRNRFAVLSPHLDEKGRRLLAVIEAQCLGRGGIKQVSDLIGVARSTIRRGLKDLDGVSSPARPRRTGSGARAAGASRRRSVGRVCCDVDETPIRRESRSTMPKGPRHRAGRLPGRVGLFTPATPNTVAIIS